MRSIYTGAIAVWAWTESSSDPNEFVSFDQLASDSVTHQPVTNKPEDRLIKLLEYLDSNASQLQNQDNAAKLEQHSQIRDATAWYCLFALGSRPYWRRRWVFQELHATESAFVFFVDHLISVKALYAAGLILYSNSLVRRIEREFSLPTAWYRAYTKYRRSTTSLFGHKDFRRSRAGYKEQPWHFLYLLISFGWGETSREEDKFFAYRSFAPNDGALGSPTYGQELLHLYLHHAKYFAANGLAVQMLQYGGLAWRRNEWCPSWCPDFTSTGVNHSLTRCRLLVTQKARQGFFEAQRVMSGIQIEGRKLNVSVSFECRVTKMDSMGKTQSRTLNRTLPRCYTFVRENRHLVRLPASQEVLNTVDQIRTMPLEEVEKTHKNMRHPLVKLGVALQTLLAPLTEDEICDEVIQERLRLYTFKHLFGGGSTVSYGLFVTDDGLLGISTRHARVGDALVLFPGAWLPMLVRKKEGDQYEVVADVFVLGLRGKKFLSEDEEGPFDLLEADLTPIILV